MRCELCRLDVVPRGGKCPRCRARLVWKTPKNPPGVRARRWRPSLPLLVGVLVVVGFVGWAAWVGWGGAARAAARAKEKELEKIDCEALVKKLLSASAGRTVTAAELELFKTRCARSAPSP